MRDTIVVVTAAVLIELMPTAVPALSEKVHAGAVGIAVPNVIVQAVADVMPVTCPLLSVEPATAVPLPHELTTGAAAW